MFWCVKETSQGDVSFTRPKLMFDRENNTKHTYFGR